MAKFTTEKVVDNSNRVVMAASYQAEANGEDQNSVVLIDISALDKIKETDPDVDSLKIECVEVSITAHATSWTDTDEIAVFLMDSNFHVLKTFDRYSDGKYEFSRAGGITTKDIEKDTTQSDPNGDLYIGFGSTLNDNGTITTANAALGIGSGYNITVHCRKRYAKT